MIRISRVNLLRPRHIMFTPPPLNKREGTFLCRFCNAKWTSKDVLVTRATQRVYQGESCERCGSTVKPFRIASPERSVFNRNCFSPIAHKNKARGKHSIRFDWRVSKGRR